MKLLRNPFVVGLLVVIAGLLIFRSALLPLRQRLFPAKKPAQATVAASTAREKQPETSPQPQKVVPDQGIDFNRVGWMKSLRRDPFLATGSIQLIEKPTAPAGKAQELLTLQAIWRQTAGRLAVINGRVIGEGDTIAGFKVDRIEGDWISLLGASGPERLDFKSSSPVSNKTVSGKNNAANPAPGPAPAP